MLDFIKNKAAAVKDFAVDKTKAVAGYVADKAKDTVEWYSDMQVTPREKIVATLGGIAGVGAAWAAFTLGFGSAPITAVTLGLTPLATTAVTALAAGTGYAAKKLASGALNLAIDGVESLAATHPDRNEGTRLRDKAYCGVARNFGQGTRFDRWFSGEYRPDHYSSEDYQLEGDIDATEKKGLLTDLAAKAVDTFTSATLFSRGNKAVQYTLTPYTQKEINAIPERTTRSGMKF